jgi:hypothetical protein
MNMMDRYRTRLGRFQRLVCALVAGLALPATAPAQAQGSGESAELFESVRKADLRLAAIGWRLATANMPLCERLEAGTGLQLHTLDQFDAANRAGAKAHFGFATQVAVEAVVPDSPAEQAGLRPDDSLVRVGTVDIAALAGKPGTTQRLVAAQLAIAALPPSAPIDVEVLRAGASVRTTVQPVPICKSRFELRLANDFNASADGTMVQISARFLEDYPEEQVAAVVAHEFAHNILHHRDRLEARGVDWGLLAGFGGNVKYFRQTELQADVLGVYLLANAGYPPQAAPAFWRKFGPSNAGSIFRSRSHPAWRDRIATIEAEIAKLETLSVRPMIPAVVRERSQPLSGDWQSLLVRSR